jgi:hypothetical protein
MATKTRSRARLVGAHNETKGSVFNAAEQGADPRSGQADRITGVVVERQGEAVPQDFAQGGQVEFIPLGGQALAAQLVPVAKHLAA